MIYKHKYRAMTRCWMGRKAEGFPGPELDLKPVGKSMLCGGLGHQNSGAQNGQERSDIVLNKYKFGVNVLYAACEEEGVVGECKKRVYVGV